MTQALRTLASIKPPKEEGYNEGTIQDAINACPVMKSFQSIGNLDAWQAGVFTTMGNLHDAFVDTGDDEVLTEITEESIAIADDYLTQEENRNAIAKTLPELQKALEDGDNPFNAGVICAFTATLLQIQAGQMVEPELPEMGEPETIDKIVPSRKPEILPPPEAAPRPRVKTDFNELVEALHISGMDVNRINLNVVRRGDRNIVTMTGLFGHDIPFGEIAKINAVFKTLTGKDLVISAFLNKDRVSQGDGAVGFSHEI